MIMEWKLKYTTRAKKDYKKISNQDVLKDNLGKLLSILTENPFKISPPYEKLNGGGYSRRINMQHRLVYDVDAKTHTINVKSMYGHYDD